LGGHSEAFHEGVGDDDLGEDVSFGVDAGFFEGVLEDGFAGALGVFDAGLGDVEGADDADLVFGELVSEAQGGLGVVAAGGGDEDAFAALAAFWGAAQEDDVTGGALKELGADAGVAALLGGAGDHEAGVLLLDEGEDGPELFGVLAGEFFGFGVYQLEEAFAGVVQVRGVGGEDQEEFFSPGDGKLVSPGHKGGGGVFVLDKD